MTYFVTGATGFIGRFLVERLLDTARLNAGELPLDYADCELRALLHEIRDR